jgi:hypothetical protein
MLKFYLEQLLNIVSDRTSIPTRDDIDSEPEFLNQFQGINSASLCSLSWNF